MSALVLKKVVGMCRNDSEGDSERFYEREISFLAKEEDEVEGDEYITAILDDEKKKNNADRIFIDDAAVPSRRWSSGSDDSARNDDYIESSSSASVESAIALIAIVSSLGAFISAMGV